ncbi:ankyrin repeat-containing domain protein [Biscogniauxia mediterranea]|nr:ankyrin repeat-containing domain protein [Biscogniauxia mediterranea]
MKHDMPSSLSQVAERGHLRYLPYLIERGTDVKESRNNVPSPLMSAARHGHYECVPYLPERGTLIDWEDEYGETALFEAVSNENFEIAGYLLDQGATDIDKTVEGHGLSALHHARTVESISIILQYGPNVDLADFNGRTALHYRTDGASPSLPVIRKIIELVTKTPLTGGSETGKEHPKSHTSFSSQSRGHRHDYVFCACCQSARVMTSPPSGGMTLTKQGAAAVLVLLILSMSEGRLCSGAKVKSF